MSSAQPTSSSGSSAWGHRVALRPVLELRGDGHHERLAGRPVHDGDHPGRPAEHPADFYEAAEIDGASSRQAVPPDSPCRCCERVLTPAIILGTVWTFNNINVPYSSTERARDERHLVTALFRQAFQYNRYGDAARSRFVVF